MYFPFMINVAGACIVIVGGGTVAYRKLELFHQFGAKLRVVSPKLSPVFADSEADFDYAPHCFTPEDLNGAFAAVAASNDKATNNTVAEECRRRRIPVNVVDDPDNCTFFVPAILRRGDMTISVSTGGKSPALAGKIRRELSEQFGADYEQRLELLGELRPLAKAHEADIDSRRRLLMHAAQLELPDLKSLVDRYRSQARHG